MGSEFRDCENPEMTFEGHVFVVEAKNEKEAYDTEHSRLAIDTDTDIQELTTIE